MDAEVFYTYMTQGSIYTTPSSQATENVNTTFFDEIDDPLHSNPLHLIGCNEIIVPLLSIADKNSILGLDVDLFTFDTPVDGIKYIHLSGDVSYTVWITALDSNRNVISDYASFGMQAGGIYDQYCSHAAVPDNYYGPITVALTGFYSEDLQQDVISFSFLSPFDDVYRTRYSYPLSLVNVSTTSGRNDQLLTDMLNGVLADMQGIAPTGGEAGGGGMYNRPDEEIPVPALPSISVCDTGFISLYVMTTAEMQQLGNYLWSNSFYSNIIKNFQDPFNNIVSLQMVPFTPTGTSGHVKIGNVDTGVTGDKLSTSFFEVYCGVKYTQEYFKTFADYAPYTKVHIYLPYCGIFELNPDDIFSKDGGGIKVTYHIDVFSGSCIAYVECNSGGKWHVLQQHAGNISAQFPITGANFASVYIGAINAIGSVAGGAATGGAMGVLGGGISGMNSIMNAKPEFQRSGGVTSVSGIMGIQYPYLIYSTPQYIVAENFRDVKGHVSNLKCTVSSCSGFLQASADNSELSGIGCTAYELDLIRNLLAEGIYI